MKSHIEKNSTPKGLDERLFLLVGLPESSLPHSLATVLEVDVMYNTPDLLNLDCWPDGGGTLEYLWTHHYTIPTYDQFGSQLHEALFIIATAPVIMPFFTRIETADTKPCTIWLTLLDGLITGYSYLGAGCERFPMHRDIAPKLSKYAAQAHNASPCP